MVAECHASGVPEVRDEIGKYGFMKVRNLARNIWLAKGVTEEEKAELIRELGKDTSKQALGKITIFIEFLGATPSYSKEVAKELVQWNWLMECIEEIYDFFFSAPFFERLTMILSMLILNIYQQHSNSEIILQLEKTLVKHLLNPHVLCYEIVFNLWIFIFQNCDEDFAKRYLQIFCEMVCFFFFVCYFTVK